MMAKNVQKDIRTRKFLVALPVLVIPFLCLGFWALGGGRAQASGKTVANNYHGINPSLPDAHFTKRKSQGKLDLYEEMSKDSAKLRAAMKNDPYFNKDMAADSANTLQHIFDRTASKFNQHFTSDNALNPKNGYGASPIEVEAEVQRKMEFLKNQLSNRNAVDNDRDRNPGQSTTRQTGENMNPDVARLERIMSIGKKPPEPDPDLKRLDSMLDKIMTIQHPEQATVKDKVPTVAPAKVFMPKRIGTAGIVGTLDTVAPVTTENVFFALNATDSSQIRTENALEAVIQETQTLVSGATVKLRLTSAVSLAGYTIPKDQFIYGVSSLSNERLKISVTSVRVADNILPVNLEVYDLDGMPGIYVPGSINRDVVKQSGDQAIGGIGLTTLDPSIGAQAASAGIQTAKTLLSRKVKLVQVTVRQGYRVLLRRGKEN